MATESIYIPPGGGTPTLTSTYIGYGNSNNLLTGSSDFTYDPTGSCSIGFSGGSGTKLQIVDAAVAIYLYTHNIKYVAPTGTLNIDITGLTNNRSRTEPDKDGTYAMTSDITTALTPVPQWVKVSTKTFTDFSTAGATNTIASGYLLPANGVITGCQVIPTVAFSGGTIATYTVSVGISSSHLKYAVATNVFTGFTLSAPNVLPGIESTTTTTSITLTATATVGLLNAATAGSVDIYLLVSTLS